MRVTLTQPMSLGHRLHGGGSHVLELAPPARSRSTPCDADRARLRRSRRCCRSGAATRSPSCSPGTYNVIVAGVPGGQRGHGRRLDPDGHPGDRSARSATTASTTTRDGSTDCADRKCVTAPICAKFACRADQSARPPAARRHRSVSAVVQTSRRGDDQTHTTCVAARRRAGRRRRLPGPGARRDVTLEWAQVGNHDFALYDNDGTLLACDAGKSLRLHLSRAGWRPARTSFTALPPGRYHLVVDADAPGTEGGVALAVLGQAARRRKRRRADVAASAPRRHRGRRRATATTDAAFARIRAVGP